jgi:hypothetical protein
MSRQRVFDKQSPRRILAAVLMAAFILAFALWLLGGSVAQAQPRPEPVKAQVRACRASLHSAQEMEKSGQLAEASQLFASCADKVCGASVWRGCVAGNSRVRAILPSIIPVAVDKNGDPRADVEVKMDGRVITSELTGRPIAVDPGPHDFSFSVGSGVFASAKITIVEGERNRSLSVTAAKGADASPSATAANRP